MLKDIRRIVPLIVLLTVILSLTASVSAQDVDVIAPETLNRLSWGAVIAGAVIALILQLALNLLGISIGVNTINPQYGEDSAEPQSLATGAAVWIGLSTLVSLFAGGWLAARFAGLPNDLDGMLHGIMVWGVVMLISMFLLLTGIGRIISGTSSIISHGLTLAGQAAQIAGQGVASVARGVAGVAGSAAQTAAHTAQNAAENVARDAQRAAWQAGGDPMQRIQDEVRKMMAQAGVSPDRVRSTAENAVNEAKNTAQQVAREPAEAERLVSEAINRVFANTQNMINEVDRQDAINVIMTNTNMTREQAQQVFNRWEQMYHEGTQQVQQARDQVANKVQEVRTQAEHKIDEIRHDVDRTARETAQSITDAIARIAGIAFAAIVIGAVAAGVGGLIGAPEEVPVIVEEVGQLPQQQP